MPSKAAGTIPKSVSAAKRPPTDPSEEKIRRKPRSRASVSSEVFGSVMAMKREPSPLLKSQKRLNAAITSAVPPDLLAAMYKLFSGG